MCFSYTAPSLSCLPFHLLIFPVFFLFSFFSSPHSYLMFFTLNFSHCFGLLLQSLPLLPSSPGFLCSILSVIPPPTLSQVKRFLPCFSSNWQMRCMSWLHCCFIRKQLFTLSLPPSSCVFSLHLTSSFPLYPALFPPYLITLFFVYLPVCAALIDVNWWMRGRSYKSPQGV